MYASIFVAIAITGVVESDEWIPSDVEQASPQFVMLCEGPTALERNPVR